jgi:hypothetical protein
LKGLKAKRAAEFNHALTVFYAREPAAVLDVFPANRASQRFVSITDCVFQAHNYAAPNHQSPPAINQSGAALIQTRNHFDAHFRA